MTRSVDRPRVGVVTICRNDLYGLLTTLASCATQIHSPYRVAVVDGASTDGTIDWLREQDLPRNVTWTSEQDRGIYDAMNKGIARVADCDLVVFMNAGDQFAGPDTLLMVTRDFSARGWAWAYGEAEMVDEHGCTLWLHQLRHLGRLRHLSGVGSVPHQTAVFSRRLLQQVGGFRLDLTPEADQEHIYRCWLVAKPRCFPTVLARCDGGGVSSTEVPGSFALKMANIRREAGRPVLGSSTVDRCVTELARRHLVIRAQARERKLRKQGLLGAKGDR